MSTKISKKAIFNDYPNARPIDRRGLKKFKNRVYTEEVLLYNPFETAFSHFLSKFESDDVVYIDRRLFKSRRWITKSSLGKRHSSISITRRVKIHRLFDTYNQMLTYKLGKE